MTTPELFGYYRKDVYGLTQDEMSKNLGVSISVYKNYENGRTPIPFDIVVKFVGVLSALKPKNTNFNDIPISILKFLYQDSSKEPKEEQKLLDVMNNVIQFPKYFDKRLFPDIFDSKQPMYMYFLGCPDFIPFLKDIEGHMKDYKALFLEKKMFDLENAGKKLNDEVQKNYENRFIKKPNEIKLLIKSRFYEFMNKLLSYYCNDGEIK